MVLSGSFGLLEVGALFGLGWRLNWRPKRVLPEQDSLKRALLELIDEDDGATGVAVNDDSRAARRVSRWQSTQTRNNKHRQTMALKIQPLGDRVLVEPIEEAEVKKGGIIIPDSAKEKPQESKVVALGTGKVDDDGKKVPFEVKKGDTVLVSKYGGTEIKLDGKEYKIMNSDDILAILK